MGEQVSDALRRVKFTVDRHRHGIHVPTRPHFDSPETTAWFTDQLKNSSAYLEFGSGGSTYLAAELGIPFATVESDRGFLTAVRERIQADGLAQIGQVYHYADIGPTGRWGRPLGRVGRTRLRKFRAYSDIPPHLDATPDLVLVDGRFRVACAMKVMRRFDTTLVVDDYGDRPHYRVLEDYATVTMVGRMAVLTDYQTAPDEVVRGWEIDWR